VSNGRMTRVRLQDNVPLALLSSAGEIIPPGRYYQAPAG
jgi:hypothetical protein